MLKLRPNCECCDKDLPPDAADALICTFECTFCADCATACWPAAAAPTAAESWCAAPCARPPCSPGIWASTERVLKPHAGCGKAA